MITHITSKEMVLYAAIEKLEKDKAELLQELINIASAKPSTWEDPSEFKSWVQSRAQHAIARVTGEAK